MQHASKVLGLALFLAVARAGAPGPALGATPCPPGSFDPLLNTLDGTPLLGESSASPAFVVGTDTISIGACGSVPAHIRARRRYTYLRAVWDDCPGFGRVRVRGWTNFPPCKALVAVLRWRDPATDRRKALKFELLRIDE